MGAPPKGEDCYDNIKVCGQQWALNLNFFPAVREAPNPL
jgi:hypothetical protein